MSEHANRLAVFAKVLVICLLPAAVAQAGPSGACCFEDGSCSEVTEEECGLLGGDFWEKLRSLFVHRAYAVIPEKPAKSDAVA